MIAEQQIKIPMESISHKPFEDKPAKKQPEPRDRRKSGEEKRKSAGVTEDHVAKRVSTGSNYVFNFVGPC